MTNAAVNIENNVRPLRPADLEQVIAIDSVYVGEPRRRFFEKRLAHAEKHPEDFVHVGVALNGALVGFAFARILRGEFGRSKPLPCSTRSALMSGSRERGVGHALMGGLTEVHASERGSIAAIPGRLD